MTAFNEIEVITVGVPDGISTATIEVPGLQGPAGPATTLQVGTVTTGEAGSLAAVSLAGTAPNLLLHLTIPAGPKGAAGNDGPRGFSGAPNTLTIGTVATGAAAATITGTSPNQVLNLTLPQGAAGANGAAGATGATGSAGPAGADGKNPNYFASSNSSVAFGTGASKTWTTTTVHDFKVGMYVRATNTGNQFMSGTVTSVTDTTLAFTPDTSSTTGTGTSWTISLSGPRGTAGTNGTNGTTPVMQSTSTTSNTIGTGTKNFTTAAALTTAVGQVLRVWNTATPANYMVGRVSSLSSTALGLDVTEVGGSGTSTAWTVAVGAFKGDTGAAGSGGSSVASYARAYKNAADQTITSYTDTTVTLNTFGTVLGTRVATTTNGVKATTAGLFLVSVAGWLTGGSAGERNLAVRVNGNIVREFGTSAAGASRVSFSDAIVLAADDVVTVTIYTAVNSVLVTGSTEKDTALGLTYLGSIS